MNPRSFLAILSLGTLCALPALASGPVEAKTFGAQRTLRFELRELTNQPFFAWPKTLLAYPVRFAVKVKPQELRLKDLETGRAAPFQLSGVKAPGGYLEFATVNFLSDLPAGGFRAFELTSANAVAPAGAPATGSRTAGSLAAGAPAAASPVSERREGDTIVLDGGAVKVRIPASGAVQGEAPGPILQVSSGGAWIGSGRIVSPKRRVLRIDATREEAGPLFTAYKIAYAFERGATYIVRVRVVSGYDFVQFREEMEGLGRDEAVFFENSWTGFSPTHRQAPNHPYLPRGPEVKNKRAWDSIPWERIDETHVSTQHGVSSGVGKGGELPFRLGAYQPWGAYVMLTSACFWDERSGDTLGVFIDRAEDWQDHEYAIWSSSNTLQVRYFYRNGKLSWRWPLVTGTRSTGIAAYDHRKDIETIERLDRLSKPFKHSDGLVHRARLAAISYTHSLQIVHGLMDLNRVKDWVLDYPDTARRPLGIFPEGSIKSAAELEKTVMTESANSMMLYGARQNTGTLNPVASRRMYENLTDAFSRLYPSMTPGQRRRITARYLMLAYVAAGEDFMPMLTMLSGHPNFLSDVKSVPALAAFLFPEHPMAQEWADEFGKFLELNTRYHTRPAVPAWQAAGGRWTENLGTYLWAFLRPAVRAEFALRTHFDGRNRMAVPQVADIAGWALNALSAPFAGEDPSRFAGPDGLIPMHFWGTVTPQNGPRRLHPPQGAHSARRMPPRVLWWLGDALRNYRPLLAEHLMWAARPTDDDAEHRKEDADPWRIMYAARENRGTNPHLRTSKYTGYGITLRAAVDTPDEISVHLQQIDDGPNYRWGIAGEGGNGVIYYYAKGKSYSHNGREDVGDRSVHDTDFCSNFGVWKNGAFRSIGRNVLERPLYDFGSVQFAELLPRQGAGEYSWPEYQGRSVMMAGSDYIVTYDHVFSDAIAHRFSWFSAIGDDMPFIHMVKGGVRERQELPTKLETREVRGVWHDGMGDAMAVITHKPDVQVEAQPFGCMVKQPASTDWVFNDPDGIEYNSGGVQFSGSAGIARRSKDGGWQLAVFKGKAIAAGGVVVKLEGDGLGVRASFTAADQIAGMSFGRKGGRLSIECAQCSGAALYVDGERQQGTALSVALPAGQHRWQLTRGLPEPGAAAVLRTENAAGSAKVIWAAAPGADRYGVQISSDGARSWKDAGETNEAWFLVRGLEDGLKYHVRVTAANSQRAGGPGPEYPVYATSEAPAHPDGLRLEIGAGKVAASWGEVLGAREYRLYRRARGAGGFRLVYAGTSRTFTESVAGVVKPFERPGHSAQCPIYEYAVSAVNGNGEGPRSPLADTDPASWVNWDPKPGEPFRRRFTYNTLDYLRLGTEEAYDRYYPQ